MKKTFFLSIILLLTLDAAIYAQTTFTLNPLTTFGSRGDGSIQPGDALGTNPFNGYSVLISAQNTPSAWFPGETTQDNRPTGSTNGFNMRGLTFDPVTGNLIYCDTHEGSGGTVGGNGALSPYSAIYILDPNSGQIIGALNTNGMLGGAYTHVVPGVADDGVVYVCNQTTASATVGFKIYRWPTANTNLPAFTNAPVVAFSNTLGTAIGTSGERVGLTMDVRGAGTNTQIIIGTANVNGTGTNIFLFTTANGTNFAAHRLGFPGAISTAVFDDGIAFGPTNTFWAKQVGKPLLYLSYDDQALAAGGTNPNAATNQITGTVIATFNASSPNDPLLNIAAIAYDPVNKLLAGMEEIGGTATGGRGKVWLFDFPNPTNHAPSILASRTYIPNFAKATAPMGYLRFGNGRLYANVVNNGLLASTVDATPLSPPIFTQDLSPSTRALLGTTAHFEVTAVTDVTNYQWYTNSVPVAGANSYYLDVPNVQTNMSGTVYSVVAQNAAGSTPSANSTLTVLSVSDFFHLNTLWSKTATNLNLSDPTTSTTNYMTSGGGSGAPNERTIAYHSLSNQLLLVRGPNVFTNLRVFVLDADTGNLSYLLKTNGISNAQTLFLCGIGVADDGAVYAANVASDSSFKVYRWADSGSNTLPQVIWGTNSPAGAANPIGDLTGSQFFRFGDNLAVHGSGINTEIILDSQNSTKYVGILRPTDDSMTNWAQTGYLLQNIAGSYGSEAYSTVIGRSLQFGSGSTFWQKRYNAAAGAPLAEMSYTSGGGLSPLALANFGLPLFTNGSVALNFSLNVAATVNFVGSVGNNNNTTQDTVDYYDFTVPSQAVLLSRTPLPGASSGGHLANGNAIAQVVFGANPNTGNNYIFVINGNNGVSAYVLAGGVPPPPKLITQPKNVRVLQGNSGNLSVIADQLVSVQWFKGTNPPVYTGAQGNIYTIVNAQTTAAGDYFAVATNINGSVTSQVAHVSVGLPNDNYTLSLAWAAPAGNASYPFVTGNGGANTPNERSFAYNAPSNQLIIVRCPPGSTAYTNWVLDATSGAVLYTLNTSGVIHEGVSEVSGANPIDLVGAAATEDGAIYICCESPNSSGGAFGDTTKMLHVYRWADSGPGTAPVMIYQGDPSGQPPGINLRWGDVLTARGSGTNTELFLNAFEGTYGAVLKPLDSTMTLFTNFWFGDNGGGGSIGRSVQFGPANIVLEKRKGASLFLSSYNLTNQASTLLYSVDSSSTLGGVFVDANHNLAMGVDFIGNPNTKPDAVALYDISDPSTPMLLADYNFPSNQVANANVICQTIVSSNRVYSLDANNGLMAFNINPPVNSLPMVLNITSAGTNLILSWTNPLAVLQQAPSLTPPISWSDISTIGQLSVTNDASSGRAFYRLIRRP